jgi:hypothetical protein
MKWCKEDIEQVRYYLYIISWTCSISSLHHFMDLLDILFTSFHELFRYPLYIISWTCSISSLHPWNDVKRISNKYMKWCRGYRASPWNDVKRISSKSMKWCKEDIEHGLSRYPLYIILCTCSISSLHHLMNLLDILFTSFHELTRYPLYIISWTC